jgi:CHAT domain-containing protein
MVPDGAIQLVSFGALPSGAGRFLVETSPPISVLAAERDLVRLERQQTGRGLLAMGGVDYEQTSPMEPGAQSGAIAMRRDTYRSARTSCAGFAQLEMSPLPAAAEEVREIADLWRASAPDPEFRLLTGAAASEDHLKTLAPAHRFLHLATHGFFLGPECDSAHVSVGALQDSPLLRSGLALSGFNARSAASIDGEDGVLTAEEVAALDLGAVDCVVLSACESGVGLPTAGEGVLGLRRAFQLAGARTLVTALWRVEDRASRSWMRRPHRVRTGPVAGRGGNGCLARDDRRPAPARAAGHGGPLGGVPGRRELGSSVRRPHRTIRNRYAPTAGSPTAGAPTSRR